MILFLPWILAVIGAQHIAANNLELLVKLVLELALPLEGQVGGCDDEGALDQAANFDSLINKPAMIVLPTPGSSASKKRIRGSFMK